MEVGLGQGSGHCHREEGWRLSKKWKKRGAQAEEREQKKNGGYSEALPATCINNHLYDVLSTCLSIGNTRHKQDRSSRVSRLIDVSVVFFHPQSSNRRRPPSYGGLALCLSK